MEQLKREVAKLKRPCVEMQKKIKDSENELSTILRRKVGVVMKAPLTFICKGTDLMDE